MFRKLAQYHSPLNSSLSSRQLPGHKLLTAGRGECSQGQVAGVRAKFPRHCCTDSMAFHLPQCKGHAISTYPFGDDHLLLGMTRVSDRMDRERETQQVSSSPSFLVAVVGRLRVQFVHPTVGPCGSSIGLLHCPQDVGANYCDVPLFSLHLIHKRLAPVATLASSRSRGLTFPVLTAPEHKAKPGSLHSTTHWGAALARAAQRARLWNGATI